MNRVLITLAVVAIGCEAEPVAQHPGGRRTLVTDNIPLGTDRATVRSWHDAHDWCARRTWPSTDEFRICNNHEYLNLTTPPMYTLVGFARDRAISYAVFVPVPCRLDGQCDRLIGRTFYPPERGLVDDWHGLVDHLADAGRRIELPDAPLPEMQRLAFDELAAELDQRYGPPAWQDARRAAMVWSTPSEQIGLFVTWTGRWIVETHELTSNRPPAP